MFFIAERIEKYLQEIRESIYRERVQIAKFKYYPGDCPGAQRVDFDDRDWKDFQVGGYWGGYDVTAWFRGWVQIPPRLQDQKLALRFRVGPRDGGSSTAETMVFANGNELQAVDVWHEEVWLPPEVIQDGEILLALKAWSGVIDVPEARHFQTAELVRIDEATEHFYFLADTLLKSIQVLDESFLGRTRILRGLEEAFGCIDFLQRGSERYYESMKDALACLETAARSFTSLQELKPTVTGIGHAHIDMAWLWRLKDTREKAARTFATALHLMRQYPEYRFMHSSPQLYRYLQEDHPELFRRVKEQVEAGNWEITGGMWVEADTNLSGGEALIRQIVYGKRFIREEFGKETYTLWLPDVFGYSAALPQLIRKSGLKYFVTTKLSWSQFNRFPHDTFSWRGLDGSEVLTHFVTTPENNTHRYTYNGILDPMQVKGIWEQYRQKDLNEELLFLFGWGDGGGGPTREMLESARVLENVPGIPSVRMGTVEDFLGRLEARTTGKKLPVWDGELYLEYHRGTYTSQAWNKRANRSMETLYHNAEWLSSLAELIDPASDYPQGELRKGWEMLLLNQFHDILPGSSIHEVYEDSRKDYAAIRRIGEEAVRSSVGAVTKSVGADRNSVILFNPLSWARSGLIELPWSKDLEGRAVQSDEGQPQMVQVNGRGRQRTILFATPEIPALGLRALPLVDSASIQAAENEIVVTPQTLENRFYRIELTTDGQIRRLWDKVNQREVLAAGEKGNVFQVFEDKPMDFDAWDIDIYALEKRQVINQLVSMVVEESGPVRGALRLTWKFAGSTLNQRILIYRDSPRIDFQNEADWHEHQTLLKVAFPTAVRATRATYDIQFGNLERPTHWNTSWDWARFEVPAHKWADLSEGNYGVSLLNDCKYGYDIHDQVMRLTLIKSGVDPDPNADQGRHEFTYSLLPHRGDWRSSRVVEEAYDLNNPLWGVRPIGEREGRKSAGAQFARLETDGVMVETVKKAEDGDGWIVRVYEYQQCHRERVELEFGQELQKAEECNLVEEGGEPVEVEGRRLRFSIAPYEIKTFRVWM